MPNTRSATDGPMVDLTRRDRECEAVGKRQDGRALNGGWLPGCGEAVPQSEGLSRNGLAPTRTPEGTRTCIHSEECLTIKPDRPKFNGLADIPAGVAATIEDARCRCTWIVQPELLIEPRPGGFAPGAAKPQRETRNAKRETRNAKLVNYRAARFRMNSARVPRGA
jgi:hypothetical protein